MITVQCGSCGKGFKVDEKFAGKRARCAECGDPIDIPEVSAAASAPRTRRAPTTPAPAPAAAPSQQDKPRGASFVLGVIAMPLGILAALGALVPLLGCFALPFAAVAAILGLVGLILALKGKTGGLKMNIAGLALGVVAFGVYIILTMVLFRDLESQMTEGFEGFEGFENIEGVDGDGAAALEQMRTAMEKAVREAGTPPGSTTAQRQPKAATGAEPPQMADDHPAMQTVNGLLEAIEKHDFEATRKYALTTSDPRVEQMTTTAIQLLTQAAANAQLKVTVVDRRARGAWALILVRGELSMDQMTIRELQALYLVEHDGSWRMVPDTIMDREAVESLGDDDARALQQWYEDNERNLYQRHIESAAAGNSE